ncbi:acyl-CoA carboxylase subunit beta [Rhodoferax antarcticus]|uniref:Methylmalonyl-CoA carboxyltransferase 12S subunit n=1 Tax=Rhodoferax antarcticus ANT.BR TaxID=1111071 RepID=A0A1Q8YAE8_9BURK|nr:acyl-CoA carboxylase subunit beta [Rhodoferax antarcticus]APW47076.1 methylmalonyl-CoA carboxyltransferase [Rhodoferax antarcticus]MCW2311585.1 acetyl-CoA carboxylase carboxyltransferase component [Rhodoferax antarcticus]OLP04953.1 methylmalonyl-CoA carboxyltransferase 12S subunit [Rhodoferax antarcticus ANT.BR]
MTLSLEAMNTLRRRREKIIQNISPEKLAALHAKGMLSARERVNILFLDGSFQELGMHAHHNAVSFGMAGRELPTDGVITGTGYVGNMQVAAFSQDFQVLAGTMGKMQARKIVRLMRHALRVGVPMVAFKDSGGARIQEGVDALSGYGDVFYYNVMLSGVVPQIAVVLGPCAGGAAYSPALMDFVIMARHNAYMFLTGPEVIKAVTGRTTTMDEVGSAEMHASVSGNVHFIAEDDQHAIALVKNLLSYLPPNNTEDPPHDLSVPIDEMVDQDIKALIPGDSSEPLNMHAVIQRLVDRGELLEVHAGFARNVIVGFARISGAVVGIVANNPMVMAGALDMDAADKIARFVRTCNVFNIPLVTLVDVPGFLPGVEEERGGIIRHGAKMLHAFASATVPKLTVILRKSYGGSYLAMCSQEMRADMVYAWPSAEIAVMGAEAAVKILYRKEIKEAADGKAKAAELTQQYRDEFASPYAAASNFYITDVIDPADTRWTLALALRKTLGKRELRPGKKHGNMPL